MTDIRQCEQYANYIKNEGWTVERIHETNYFIRKISFLGSVLKLQRPEKLDIDTLSEIAKKHQSFQIIVEPNNNKQAELLAKNGFKLDKSTYLPSKTLQIDLRASEKTIFSNFKKDARQAVKRGEGQIIKEYKTPDEIKTWHKAWKKSVSYKRYVPSVRTLLNIKKSFPQNNSLFLASHNIVGRIIGGVLFTISSHDASNYITYYWYGFTNEAGRTSLSQYSLLHQGILWGKKMGCKTFDFEGIYDERFPNKSWLGFTHFKESFGGIPITYPGCYTKTDLFVKFKK